MRLEQFTPGPEFNATEWYVACLQIEIEGPGGARGVCEVSGGVSRFE